MKNLIVIAVAFLALQATAQEQKNEKPIKGERLGKMMNLSAEDAATHQTKKMTLHLDLTASQQAEIQKINLENATKRKVMMEERKAKKESGELKKPSDEERLKMANAKLDHQISMKAKMKKILNDEQYVKWEKSQIRKGMKRKEGMKKRMHKEKQE
jgi:predicted lipase